MISRFSVLRVNGMRIVFFCISASLVFSGCVAVPFNKSPSQLKQNPGLFQSYKTEMTLNDFMQHSFEAKKMCADNLVFERSPDGGMAIGMIQLPGMTSTATIVYMEVTGVPGGTKVDMWMQSAGWKDRAKKFIDQVIDPGICIK